MIWIGSVFGMVTIAGFVPTLAAFTAWFSIPDPFIDVFWNKNMTARAMRFSVPVLEVRVASFGTHVPKIISLRAEEKVAWVNTLRIVAGVADAKPFRN